MEDLLVCSLDRLRRCLRMSRVIQGVATIGKSCERRGRFPVMDVFVQCLFSGFRHIVPDGPDHVLFVLGLFLLCRNVTALLWQVTLFTLAHSFTLGLALCGVVQMPDRPVEVLIALSIALVAVENIVSRDLGMWRTWVVIFFGLIHGFGFAGAFVEAGIPLDQPVVALLGLNIGVELGQMAVLAVAWGLVGHFWERRWYRNAITVPGSLAIGLVGVTWAVTRLIA